MCVCVCVYPVTTYVYVENQRPEFVSYVFTHVELVELHMYANRVSELHIPTHLVMTLNFYG